MSYSACSNSALLHPNGYIAGAIGSAVEPAINTNAVASAALLQPVAAFILPKGRWLIAGVVSIDATVGGQTLTGNTGIAKDAVVFWRSTIATAADGLSVVLSAVVDSDGTASITIPMTYATSGGATYSALASPSSKVQAIRIA